MLVKTMMKKNPLDATSPDFAVDGETGAPWTDANGSDVSSPFNGNDSLASLVVAPTIALDAFVSRLTAPTAGFDAHSPLLSAPELVASVLAPSH